MAQNLTPEWQLSVYFPYSVLFLPLLFSRLNRRREKGKKEGLKEEREGGREKKGRKEGRQAGRVRLERNTVFSSSSPSPPPNAKGLSYKDLTLAIVFSVLSSK